MRVGLYERISEDRTGERAGPERQHNENLELARRLKWKVVEHYVDVESATNRRKVRKAYRQLLSDIQAGRIDAIITWHPDRLYRQPSELEELIDIIERHHVMIRTCTAGEIDLSTPSGRLVARQLGAVAKYEGEQKAARWKLSVVANRKAGKWSNARDRLFGYQRDGVVNPSEAARLRWMAKQVLAGRSLLSICNELNAWVDLAQLVVTLAQLATFERELVPVKVYLRESGIATTRGNRWGAHALRYLLLNPRIAGYATHQTTATAKGGARDIVGRGQWDAVLDPDLWQRVTAALEPYRARPPRRAVLTRLVWCCCGTMMHSGARYAGVKSRPTVRIYRCPSAPPYNTGCGALSIRAEPLEHLATRWAQTKLSDRKFRAMLESRRANAGQLRDLQTTIDDLDARRRELAAELKRVGGRTASVLVDAIADVEREITEVSERRARAFAPELPSLDAGWPDDVETQNALIAITLDRLIVHPNPPPGGRLFNPDRVEIVPVVPE